MGTTILYILIAIIILLIVAVIVLAGMIVVLKKGFNENIKGLNSLDKRLHTIEIAVTKK